jgi:hypothetical protein
VRPLRGRLLVVAQQRLRQWGEDLIEGDMELLRLADVDLSHLERGVPGALLDAERVVAAHGEPGEAGGAKVVEPEALARPCGLEELGALDAGREQVVA